MTEPVRWTAVAVVGGNHDWDFAEDSEGNITALHIVGGIDWLMDGKERRTQESLDVWGLLSEERKIQVQTAYDAAKLAFSNHFLGS